MKRYISNISFLVTLVAMVTSCNTFLDETPRSTLTPSNYYKTEAQIMAAVNGIYTFVDDIFDGDIEVGTATYIWLDYLPGYAIRPRAATTTDIQQAFNLSVAENNGRLEKLWETAYKAIENCNSVIEGIEAVADGVIAEEPKNQLLGEVYFLRAFNYFNLVRHFGPVPVKIESTKDLSNVEIDVSPIEVVYEQIEKDIFHADTLMRSAKSPWTSTDGRVTWGAVKSMRAKIYLTMAGEPLKKGSEYYQKAFEQADSVVRSEKFSLFDDYSELRDEDNENKGEYIWMIQREADYAGSGVHFAMLPYPAPAKAISATPESGGAMAPVMSFYQSYQPGDLRAAEHGYYYTEQEAVDESGMVNIGYTCIYKYWDEKAAKSGKSGANYPLLRYADVLLMLAEARANMDGGSTSNAAALDAYFAVRNRAFPNESRPSSISVNDVLKERFWELCFENQTWYDMLRTRKALNVITGQIVDLIGYHAPGHNEGRVFKESDLRFPYPLREVRLNPNLKN